MFKHRSPCSDVMLKVRFHSARFPSTPADPKPGSHILRICIIRAFDPIINLGTLGACLLLAAWAKGCITGLQRMPREVLLNVAMLAALIQMLACAAWLQTSLPLADHSMETLWSMSLPSGRIQPHPRPHAMTMSSRQCARSPACWVIPVHID